jgi:hypothetical protein
MGEELGKLYPRRALTLPRKRRAAAVQLFRLGLGQARAYFEGVTSEELQQIKRLVLQELPGVLEQDPGFALFIEGILSEKFPRRDEFARLLEEVRAGRTETKERFDQVDQRFERVDQRFEQVDQRFEQVDQRFEQVDQRFEQVDQRFEQVDQRFEQMNQRLDGLTAEVRGLRNWMELNVGGFQTRAGRRLEDVVAGAFCYGLERQDIRPDQVRLRQRIVDEHGIVFRPGKEREVDMIALGAELIVFEVKSTADYDDIDDLADKVKLVEHLNPGKAVHGVLVMLGAEAEHRRLCSERRLKLIP